MSHSRRIPRIPDMTLIRVKCCAASAVVTLFSATLLGGCGTQATKKTCVSAGSATTPAPGSQVQTATLKAHGFSFHIPKGWSTIDRTAPREAVDADVASLARQLNATSEEVEEYLQLQTVDIEFFAVNSRSVADGLLDMVTVSPVGNAKAADKNIASSLNNMALVLGGNIAERGRAVDTPIGVGYTIAYTVPYGVKVEQRRGLVTGTSADDQVLITVITHSSSDADQVMKEVRASLAEQC